MPELTRRNRISRSYGGALRLSWIVEGPAGAVEFHFDMHRLNNDVDDMEISAGVETHSRTPMREGQKPIKNCSVLGGVDCYPDGSSLAGQELMPTAWSNPDWLWTKLESVWRDVFGAQVEPETAPCQWIDGTFTKPD